MQSVISSNDLLLDTSTQQTDKQCQTREHVQYQHGNFILNFVCVVHCSVRRPSAGMEPSTNISTAAGSASSTFEFESLTAVVDAVVCEIYPLLKAGKSRRVLTRAVGTEALSGREIQIVLASARTACRLSFQEQKDLHERVRALLPQHLPFESNEEETGSEGHGEAIPAILEESGVKEFEREISLDEIRTKYKMKQRHKTAEKQTTGTTSDVDVASSVVAVHDEREVEDRPAAVAVACQQTAPRIRGNWMHAKYRRPSTDRRDPVRFSPAASPRRRSVDRRGYYQPPGTSARRPGPERRRTPERVHCDRSWSHVRHETDLERDWRLFKEMRERMADRRRR